MNKKIVLTLILTLPLFLTACTKPATKTTEGTGAPSEKTSETTQKTTEQANVFTSIRDAVTKQIGLKCEYTDEESQAKVTTYIKGSKVYMEGTQKNENVETAFKGIMRDNKYYLWSEQSPMGAIGMMFDLSKVKPTDNTTGQKLETQEDIIEKLEAKKDMCKPYAIAESMFEIPTNIEFKEF